MFLKPHPDGLADDDEMLKLACIDAEMYRINFSSVNHLTSQDTAFLQRHHPAYELLRDILDTPESPSETELSSQASSSVTSRLSSLRSQASMSVSQGASTAGTTDFMEGEPIITASSAHTSRAAQVASQPSGSSSLAGATENAGSSEVAAAASHAPPVRDTVVESTSGDIAAASIHHSSAHSTPVRDASGPVSGQEPHQRSATGTTLPPVVREARDQSTSIQGDGDETNLNLSLVPMHVSTPEHEPPTVRTVSKETQCSPIAASPTGSHNTSTETGALPPAKPGPARGMQTRRMMLLQGKASCTARDSDSEGGLSQASTILLSEGAQQLSPEGSGIKRRIRGKAMKKLRGTGGKRRAQGKVVSEGSSLETSD